MTAPIVALILIAVLLFVVALSGVRIVHPFQKGIVEQLGKYKETKNPGLHVILPFAQTITMVDMREQVIDVPPQEVITSDNVVVSVDAVIYYEPTDPQRMQYNVANFLMAITKLAQTNMRNVIGDMTLDQALTSRDQLNSNLRQILDDATDNWGARVMRVEIQRIDPPPDVMAAMHEQMKAERTATARRPSSAPRATSRRPSSPPRASASARCSKRKGRRRPSESLPMPSATGRRQPPPARPRRSNWSTERSTGVAPRTTCSP